MDGLKVTGTVIGVGELYENGNFKKKDLYIETDGEYAQKFAIEFVKDKEELLDVISEGQKVEVHVNLRGRVWTNPEKVDKYFLSMNGWKIDIK